jgi:SPP1 gp7 family putative phage head morphogenesis protein
MPKIEIKPPTSKPSYWRPVVRSLMKVFNDELFSVILAYIDEIETAEAKTNDNDTDIIAALKSGRVKYVDGSFTGLLNARLSKALRAVGAKYKRGKFTLPHDLLPYNVKIYLAKNDKMSQMLLGKIDKSTSDILTKLTTSIKGLPINIQGLDIFDHVEDVFESDVKKAMSVNPTLSKESKKEIAKDYIKSKQYPIKRERETLSKTALSRIYDDRVKKYSVDFAGELVADLRNELSASLIQGINISKVREIVADKLKLKSEFKINFIAQQETQLFVSKVHIQQAKQAGSKQYRWVTIGDSHVRETHRELNGKIFDWDHPPVVSENPIRRAHPSEDFRCFLGSTHINFLGKPIKVFKRRYTGIIVNVAIEDGTIISGTPNHPVMTTLGWCHLSDLDDIHKVLHPIVTDVIDGSSTKINNLSAATDIFDFFNISHPSVRKLGSNVNFHGDGSNDEIDVIGVDSELGQVTNTVFDEEFLKNILADTYSGFPNFESFSSSTLFFKRNNSVFCCDVSRCDLSLSLVDSHLRPFNLFTFRLIPQDDMILNQMSCDDTAGTSVHLGKFFDTDTGKILFDYLVGGKVCYFIVGLGFFGEHNIIKSYETYLNDEPVFNFETSENVYLANNHLVSNCRCHAISILEW